MGESKIIQVDMDKLIIRVHNKIALWNNQSESDMEKQIMLKVLAHDIVSDVISTAFSGLEGARSSEKVIATEPPKKIEEKN